MVSRQPGDGVQEVDAIRAKKMVDYPGQLPFHIPVYPKECLLEQLAGCLGIESTQTRAKETVYIECPVE